MSERSESSLLSLAPLELLFFAERSDFSLLSVASLELPFLTGRSESSLLSSTFVDLSFEREQGQSRLNPQEGRRLQAAIQFVDEMNPHSASGLSHGPSQTSPLISGISVKEPQMVPAQEKALETLARPLSDLNFFWSHVILLRLQVTEQLTPCLSSQGAAMSQAVDFSRLLVVSELVTA